jgi:hypothetical protein
MIAKREKERLRLQEKIRLEQVSKLRESMNADAEKGEVRAAGMAGISRSKAQNNHKPAALVQKASVPHSHPCAP